MCSTCSNALCGTRVVLYVLYKSFENKLDIFGDFSLAFGIISMLLPEMEIEVNSDKVYVKKYHNKVTTEQRGLPVFLLLVFVQAAR